MGDLDDIYGVLVHVTYPRTLDIGPDAVCGSEMYLKGRKGVGGPACPLGHGHRQ